LEVSAVALGAGARALSAVPQTVSDGLEAGLTRLASTAERGAETLQAAYTSGIEALSGKSFAAWTGSCNQFVNAMNTSTVEFCGAVKTDTAASSAALTSASNRITEICNAFDTQLKESVPQLYKLSLEELRPSLRRLDEAVTDRYPAVLQNLKEASDRAVTLKGSAEDATAAFKAVEEALTAAAGEWRKAVEDAKRSVHAGPTPAELDEIRAIRAGVDRMVDRLAKPFWRTWFQRNRGNA
jgi:hypothetical protein